MNNSGRYDRSTNFLELEVNVPRTIGILRDDMCSVTCVLWHVTLCSRTWLVPSRYLESQKKRKQYRGVLARVICKCAGHTGKQEGKIALLVFFLLYQHAPRTCNLTIPELLGIFLSLLFISQFLIATGYETVSGRYASLIYSCNALVYHEKTQMKKLHGVIPDKLIN